MAEHQLSGRNRRTLERIFQHPMAMNLSWRDIVHLLEALGATVEHGAKDKLKISLNGEERFFRPHHNKVVNNKDEVAELRHLLENAGIVP